MSNPMNFENNENRAPGAGSPAAGCADWEALLPEAAEDLLGEVEAQALAVHLATCLSCEAELAEARRGAAWLSLLKEQTPEPSHDLVAGILARTTGAPTLAENRNCRATSRAICGLVRAGRAAARRAVERQPRPCTAKAGALVRLGQLQSPQPCNRGSP